MLQGADTDQLRELAASVERGAQRVDALMAQLTARVDGIDWIGTDADAFRAQWRTAARTGEDGAQRLLAVKVDLEDQADAQDATSVSGGGGGSAGTSIFGTPRESDGFWGDLLGGPESALWGNAGWNVAGGILDLAGIFGGTVGSVASMIGDTAGIGMGLYDAAQSFQDGEFFGTADGLITSALNTVDLGVSAIGLIPHPATLAIGEIGGVVTGALDLGWSALTVEAQAAAIAGGPGGGSTTQYLLEKPGFLVEQLTGYDGVATFTDGIVDGIESGYGDITQGIRETFPIIDPLLDVPQQMVENAGSILPDVEGFAADANDTIRGWFGR
jgi:hypothetical protein